MCRGTVTHVLVRLCRITHVRNLTLKLLLVCKFLVAYTCDINRNVAIPPLHCHLMAALVGINHGVDVPQMGGLVSHRYPLAVTLFCGSRATYHPRYDRLKNLYMMKTTVSDYLLVVQSAQDYNAT